MIVLRVLGPVEIRMDEATPSTELLWRKNVALLMLLARAPARSRTREQLTGLLWSEKPDAAARHSLNEAIRTIRRHLGPDSMDTSGGQVRLSADHVRLDTELLEESMAKGDLEAAGTLVSGEFMEGFALPDEWTFEEWLAGERRHWTSRCRDILCALADLRLDRGNSASALSAAERALVLDPASEAACRTAMKAMALAGDRSGAVALFESFVARFEERTGIEPGSHTMALADRIRRERGWTPPSSTRQDSDVARRMPLLDRDNALTAALDVWSTCFHDDRASIVIVEGVPGAGRTRLLEELVTRTRLDGAATAGIRAVEADRTEPWNTMAALTRALIAAVPAAKGDPGLRARLEAATAAPAAVDAWSTRLVARVVGAATVLSPVVLAVDDAQWADTASLHALEALLRDAAQRPLLIALTATSYPQRSDLDDLRSRIGRHYPGATVSVGPLRPDALQSLVRQAFPHYSDTAVDRASRRIWMDSAGLPLLGVELIHAVALGLDLDVVQGTWPQPLRTLDQTYPADLPDAVTAAIRVGFRRLSPDAREILIAASVLGDRVSRDVFLTTTNLDAQRTDRALDELEFARWLQWEPRGYSFVARIARQVIAKDMVAPGRRRRIAGAATRSINGR